MAGARPPDSVPSTVTVARDGRGDVVFATGRLPCGRYTYADAALLEYALAGRADAFPCPGVLPARSGEAFEMPLDADFCERELVPDCARAVRAVGREAAHWAAQVLAELEVDDEDWAPDWADNASVVFAFEGAGRAGEPHVNSHRREWFVYVSLSADDTPAPLLCPADPDKAPDLAGELPGADPRDVARLRAGSLFRTAGQLARDRADLERSFVPVFAGGAWATGDVVVARGDQVVADPAHGGFRAHLFFSMSPAVGAAAFAPGSRVTPATLFARLAAAARGMRRETRAALGAAAARKADERKRVAGKRKAEEIVELQF
jgi:hypothetical protein